MSSLLDNVLDLLRFVLEYFGVPPDMLVPVWDNEICGQCRSIVRMIGTNLPLTPTPRVHFQIPLRTSRSNGYIDVTMDTSAIPSLADVLWLAEDEGDRFTKFRNHLPPLKQSIVNRDLGRNQGRALNRVQRRGISLEQKTDRDALRKITVLENELLKLRAQIAIIVTAVPSSGATVTQNALGSPVITCSPALTSTPLCAPPPPPPPPPLPPPPSAPGSSSSETLLDLIRKRRNGRGGTFQPLDMSSTMPTGGKALPSMLDVLKDLNQVKLRAIKRSPGGRPVKRHNGKGLAVQNDPAALIAEALRKKFAQRLHNNSADKENSMPLSPFGSPETPRVPQHGRRSHDRRRL